MTKLDWIIVGFAGFTALMGFRQGLIRSVLALAGLAAGAVIGARVAPHFLHHGAHSPYTAVIGFVGALVGASVLHTAASSIGGKLRMAFRSPEQRLAEQGSSAGVTPVYEGEAGVAGRIREGMRADLTGLVNDPVSAPPEDVWLTVVGGRVVHYGEVVDRVNVNVLA